MKSPLLAAPVHNSSDHMKKQILDCSAGGVLLGGLLMAHTVVAKGPMATYEVHLQPAKFTLYQDPYNGNEIKVGGFSGIYPVPGSSDSFYIVTDRGPAPDFVDAGGNTFKTFAIPAF